MNFLRYSEYKNSRVQWLGEVPVHWNLYPLWTMFRRTKRIGHVKEELLSVYRDFGVIPKASRDDNFNKASDDLELYQLVVPGDLAINKMKAWQGSLGISEHRGIISPAYFVYESIHSQVPRFLHYLFRSTQYITGYMSMSKGIRVNQWDLDPLYHSRIPVLIPPIAEQSAIAAYLDLNTSKIDAMVSQQEKLIALLKEKRQAVISHAVTKGIDPTVPMKDSGIEWLGEVPEHWRICRIAHITQTVSGGTPKRSNVNEFFDGDIKWIRTLDLTDDSVRDSSEKITETALYNSNCKILPPETLMVAMYGGDGTIGKCGLLEVEATTNQAIAALLPSPNLNSHFGLRVLNFLRPYWMVFAEGTRKDPNISQNIVAKMYIPLPPIDEQATIAHFVDSQISKIDELITDAERAIDLLKERRTALISAAVTGKIDVRGLVKEEVTA